MATPTKPVGEVVKIDGALFQQHLGEIVRITAKETRAVASQVGARK